MSYFLPRSHFLHSPIFSFMKVDVSRVLLCHSSQLHFPPSPVPTSWMVRWAGSRSDVRVGWDCSGWNSLSCRSEDSGRPRLQVTLTCWPEIKSAAGEEMTGERIGEGKKKKFCFFFFFKKITKLNMKCMKNSAIFDRLGKSCIVN